MVYEFEGKTEKDAIERAMTELALERDSFDVEILEAQKGGFFKKGYVKIRLHTDEPEKKDEEGGRKGGARGARGQSKRGPGGARGGRKAPPVQTETRAEEKEDSYNEDPYEEGEGISGELEEAARVFVSTLIEKLGCNAVVSTSGKTRKKLCLNIETAEPKDGAVIIGKKGKHIDAIQLLANVYAAKINANAKIVLDCGNYRQNHEDALLRLAYSVAAKVRATRHSILLEPMNPYDRRIIHTTIGESDDIETYSEGEGLYKQVRVSFRRR